MKAAWLMGREKGQRLLVVCAGWGMDERPFLDSVSKEDDLLVLYDYRDLALDDTCWERLHAYPARRLLAWSMGVWAGQALFGAQNPGFEKAMAINGTLCPVDDRFGISRAWVEATARGWCEANRRKFYHRMFIEVADRERFLAHAPHRSVEDQQEELRVILEKSQYPLASACLYDGAWIGSLDRIMPPAHQQAFWGEKGKILLGGGHCPFYRYATLSHVLEAWAAA